MPRGSVTGTEAAPGFPHPQTSCLSGLGLAGLRKGRLPLGLRTMVGPLPSVHLVAPSRPVSQSSGPCCLLQSPTASQDQGPRTIPAGRDSGGPPALPQEAGLLRLQHPQPTDHGGGSLQVRKGRGLPTRLRRSSGRARTYRSQIPDLAPGRRARSSVVGTVSVARNRLGPGQDEVGHQMGSLEQGH